MFRFAFDIGGTFTDFVAQNTETGNMIFLKTPSTPSAVEEAVLYGLEKLQGKINVSLEDVGYIAHATTVATNAIIERKGSRTGLITTKGFRDVLILGRQKRYETYNLFLDKPTPLIRRRNIKEVNERIDAHGEIIQRLDMKSVKESVDALLNEKVESIAVTLLHAYVNPIHEQMIGDYIREVAPNVSVSLSSEISPIIREYERTSTSVADAYVKPVVTRYLDRLEKTLLNKGFKGEFYIMQSNGGLATTGLTKKRPIRIVESGPAAGVLMAEKVGLEAGIENILTFDMGGTTAKLGTVDNGRASVIPTFEVDPITYEKGSGLPLNIPSVELLEIGAGGGSIATVDRGIINVGPRSSGADPGPVCYGKGGTEVTVTDANLVLGYLNPNFFNAGQMKLDVSAAMEKIKEEIANPLDLSIGEAAWGIHRVANLNMERAMRIISIERGRDPREYTLVVYGGAGPLHAARLAHALNIPQVIVPWGAGVGSAVGLLTADRKFEVSMTQILTLSDSNEAYQAIRNIYNKLKTRALNEIQDLAGLQDTIKWLGYAYMRYKGQGHELKVAFKEEELKSDIAATAIKAFHKEYARLYGVYQQDVPVEAVDWYLVATIPSEMKHSNLTGKNLHESTPGSMKEFNRKAYFPESGGYINCKVFNRYQIPVNQRIEGPAIIEENESTIVVPPGDDVSVNAYGHLVIRINGGKVDRK